MATTYDIGDAPVVTATFRNIAGDLADPTTVTAKLREPDGTQTNLTPLKDSVGTYSVILAPFDQSGRHRVKFFGTGDLTAAEELTLNVRRTPIT
jgi:hypothetical protein